MPERTGWRGEWPSPAALRARIRWALRIEIDEPECARFLDFLRVLERWAGRFNLISASARDEVVDRHLLDSLAALELVGDAARVADLGSGAGFPGLPIAIARPAARVFLVEPRSHRANFLRQAVRTTAAANAEVVEGRGDAFTVAHAVDLVIARGVRFADVAAFAAGALAPGGRLLAMTKSPANEPAPDGFAICRRHEYRLPGGSTHALVELART